MKMKKLLRQRQAQLASYQRTLRCANCTTDRALLVRLCRELELSIERIERSLSKRDERSVSTLTKFVACA